MRYLLSIIFILTLQPIFAQNMNVPYAREWMQADSLLQRGFPESATKVVNKIYTSALQKNEQIQMIKAELYLLNIGFERSETAYNTAISKAEEQIQKNTFPIKNIWQSIAAQLYWNYYQQHRWDIINRTSVSQETQIEDFEQWDAKRFYQTVSALYEASVSKATELAKLNIHLYDPILTKAINTQLLRPTLLDILSFRALSFFENDEKDLTRPAYAFVINDEKAFAPANRFVSSQFITEDSASLQNKALRLYQQLLAQHLADTKTDALIDIDLSRLAFAHKYSVLPNKQSLYRKALEQIETQYAQHPMSGLATIAIVQLQMLQNVAEGEALDKPSTQINIDYRLAKKKLDALVAKFPNSEAGIQAKNLVQNIERKSLNITTEEVVLPSEPSKFLVQYKNVKNITVRIVAINDKETFWKNKDRYNEKEKVWEYQQLPTIKQWSVALPGTEDYHSHTTEVKIDALPKGMYMVVVSASSSFSEKDNIIARSVFQVSDISMVSLSSSGKAYTLHRKTGKPLPNIKADFYSQQYNRLSATYESARQSNTHSASDGSFTWSKNNHIHFVKLSTQDETLYVSGNYYGWDESSNNDKSNQTFFFTDRSIYRPGQTIYFKGILFQQAQQGKKNDVLKNQKTTVTFYDANYQKISTKTFTTNEFGSFSGSFTAPEGILNGAMHIQNESGSTEISVEEYKRPKFYVAFDTVNKEYTLNDKVKITGRATAYAGNTIDGATVAYRVVRTYRFPYPWLCYYYRYLPQSDEMEIVNGEVKTAADGSFQIDFKALPDETVDAKTMPLFTYKITADVTDINGETRSSSQFVNIGYTSIAINASVPETWFPNKTNNIKLRTETLNGDFVSTKVQVKIAKLKAPSTILRKRLWSQPDMYIMDSVSFKKDFPNDVYKDEDNYQQWKIEKNLWEETVTTTADGKVAIDNSIWKEGGRYIFIFSTTDKNGKAVIEKQYTQVMSIGGKTDQALTILNATPKVLPGAQAELTVISGYKNLYLLRTVKDMNGLHPTDSLIYQNAPTHWSRKITDADRGGMMVSYLTVKENRVYNEAAIIAIPWDNKDLHIRWETHRDKLQPGAHETWTMVVSGTQKEKIAAELVATLYDASLEAFKPHRWWIQGIYPTLNTGLYWSTGNGFGTQNGRVDDGFPYAYYKEYSKEYSDIIMIPNSFGYSGGRYYAMRDKATMSEGVSMNEAPAAKSVNMSMAAPAPSRDNLKEAVVHFTPPIIDNTTTAPPKDASPSVRKNLQETAFFFPELRTDSAGNVRIQFTIPESLTEWRMMAIAHAKDMSIGYIDGTIKTQKDLMVMPNLPRFLRQNDAITLSAKISNLSTKQLSGKATISLKNALTLQPVELPFRLSQKDKNFSVAAGQSTNVTWSLQVPESLYVPVIITITAQAGDFTDGEENTLPIVTNRMLVTETLPLWMNGSGTKQYQLDKLLYSDTSKSLTPHVLTLEYTANPAWYAVQALPYMMEYPYACAEQTFNRFYATALAATIVEKMPLLKQVFDKWMEASSSQAMVSPLVKNEELKSALLQETPWVLEAQDETEQQKRIALLFDAHKLSKDLKSTLKKLKDKQRPDGAFGWFDGMYPDRYITQYIVTGLAKLQKLGVTTGASEMKTIINKALPYLDNEIHRDYQTLVKNKLPLDKLRLGYTQVQYLYMRSFLGALPNSKATVAIQYYTQQAATYWPSFNAYTKGMIALALHRTGNTKVPKDIIRSLKETAITKEEMGMYWMPRGYGYWWYEAPIETQSLLIECFNEIDKDMATVDKMKLWLLKNKQTNHWETTKATADACYALLLTGNNWLTSQPIVTVQLGAHKVSSTAEAQVPGTGYFKKQWKGSEIKTDMGHITLNVSNSTSSSATTASWGAVYWQYFEDLDKISFAKTPLVVKKQLFIEKPTARGPELVPIAEKNILHVGDKAIVRIEIIVDRDMEYVHLKDMRAACFEPVNVMSTYRYQNGLGYYESTKDISTNFFFDRLNKGKYVFEYAVFTQQKGNFSNGIATIQCMYAPEFSSHSEGLRISVE